MVFILLSKSIVYCDLICFSSPVIQLLLLKGVDPPNLRRCILDHLDFFFRFLVTLIHLVVVVEEADNYLISVGSCPDPIPNLVIPALFGDPVPVPPGPDLTGEFPVTGQA